MINKEEIINYFKSIENEKFIYDNKPAKFTWSCDDMDNEHGVMGGYDITAKYGGMGTPFSENENINKIIKNIEKYMIKPKAKQLSLF